MTLKTLKLTNFRNINRLSLDLSSRINLFVGCNGVGKTSILEAVYFLSTGRSFRSSTISKLMKTDADELAINAQVCRESSSHNNLVSFIDYYRSGSIKKISLNNSSAQSLASIAEIIPVCNIAGDRFKALNLDPEYRRKLFDWGVFHVKHEFFALWKNYKNILEQRNRLIRNKNNKISFYSSWDELFIECAAKLIRIRQEYFELLKKEFISHIKLLDLDRWIASEITIDHGIKLLDINSLDNLSDNLKEYIRDKLKDNLAKDLERGYTTIGPHRADLIFRLNDTNHDKAKYYLSRGQEKMILMAFYFAQVAVFNKLNNTGLILQLDDIAAELDKEFLDKIYQHIAILSKNNQIIITALNQDMIPDYIREQAKVFHVEQCLKQFIGEVN